MYAQMAYVYACIFGWWIGHNVVMIGLLVSVVTRLGKTNRSHIQVGTILTVVLGMERIKHCNATTITTTLNDTFVTLDEHIWSLASYQACNAASDASCRYDGAGTLYINGEGGNATGDIFCCRLARGERHSFRTPR